MLELIKVRRLLIDVGEEEARPVYGIGTRFLLNTDESTILHNEAGEFDQAHSDADEADETDTPNETDDERKEDHG